MSTKVFVMFVFAVLISNPTGMAVAETVQVSEADSNAADSLPLRRDGDLMAPQVLVRVGAVLILGMVLAIVAVLVLRRTLFASSQGGHRIRIIEARRATPQLTVALVRFDDREFLIAQAGDGVALLHAESAKEQTANDAEAS